ncbi:hypothetical protein [Ensifer canadensis]|uniref:hypothetical protein n=1 Tax=Ensifer canadensis TaxID=555315 RepID=UPI00148FB5BC|nr:hypothetical protein [Ensifer canadensis]
MEVETLGLQGASNGVPFAEMTPVDFQLTCMVKLVNLFPFVAGGPGAVVIRRPEYNALAVSLGIPHFMASDCDEIVGADLELGKSLYGLPIGFLHR